MLEVGPNCSLNASINRSLHSFLCCHSSVNVCKIVHISGVGMLLYFDIGSNWDWWFSTSTDQFKSTADFQPVLINSKAFSLKTSCKKILADFFFFFGGGGYNKKVQKQWNSIMNCDFLDSRKCIRSNTTKKAKNIEIEFLATSYCTHERMVSMPLLCVVCFKKFVNMNAEAG